MDIEPLPPFLVTRDAFDRFVSAWETCALPPAEWSHAAHVAVGAAFAVRFRDRAYEAIKAGILRYNHAVGTGAPTPRGYHETLTRFWADTIAGAVAGMDDEWAAACLAVGRFGTDRNLHRRCYSFDVARDETARRTWIPPDAGGDRPPLS